MTESELNDAQPGDNLSIFRGTGVRPLDVKLVSLAKSDYATLESGTKVKVNFWVCSSTQLPTDKVVALIPDNVYEALGQPIMKDGVRILGVAINSSKPRKTPPSRDELIARIRAGQQRRLDRLAQERKLAEVRANTA
jgi:hypothetical protein